MSRKKVTIYLQTDIPAHREIYEAVMNIPVGKRSKYVVELLSAGMKQEELYHIIMRALNDFQPQFKNESEAGQVPKEMLDFVFSL